MAWALLALFVAGAVATLSVVAIGFGGYMRPRTYSVSAANARSVVVHDGDTFRIGDYSLRLYGIDAPELNQTCSNTECGDEARRWLEDHLVSGVQCDQTLSRSGRPRDGLGRALVRCFVPTDGGLLDLSEEMVRRGYAVQYKGEDYGYSRAEREAELAHAGLMRFCSLRPDVWRNDRAAREAFRRDGTVGNVESMGDCDSTQ